MRMSAKQQKQRIITELREVDTTIRQIQMQLGETPEEHSNLTTAPLPLEPTQEPSAQAAVYNPRPDEFFSLSQAEAAKMFLGKIGHAISVEQLVNGLKAGGCKVGGVDPKKTLYVSLNSNAREFVPVVPSPLSHRIHYFFVLLASRLSLRGEARLFDCKPTTHTRCCVA